ncbi:hypothetical protein NDU88_004049 [Pleurodeles waltl]|uniref:Uncharacterized protein n=1 Tax=Pleurodeles waltl TaxID=8319 RepID=A0AAV7M8W8_PLEWA|nr:hypothetical protein NDU88_004049 [Pleurodeles waltl]
MPISRTKYQKLKNEFSIALRVSDLVGLKRIYRKSARKFAAPAVSEEQRLFGRGLEMANTFIQGGPVSGALWQLVRSVSEADHLPPLNELAQFTTLFHILAPKN